MDLRRSGVVDVVRRLALERASRRSPHGFDSTRVERGSPGISELADEEWLRASRRLPHLLSNSKSGCFVIPQPASLSSSSSSRTRRRTAPPCESTLREHCESKEGWRDSHLTPSSEFRIHLPLGHAPRPQAWSLSPVLLLLPSSAAVRLRSVPTPTSLSFGV